MEKLGKFLGVSFAIAGIMFLACILSTLLGALAGWVVGLFFEETILNFFAMLGISGLKMWQIGASLGFIGSFFNTTNINKK